MQVQANPARVVANKILGESNGMRMHHFFPIIYNNSPFTWGLALGATAITFMLLKYFVRYMANRIAGVQVLSPRSRSVIASALQIHGLAAAVFSILVGLSFLSLTEQLESLLSRMVFLAICIQGGIWASHLTKALSPANSNGVTTYRSSAQGLIVTFARFGIWILILLLVLENWGINITALVASLGIGGIAVALAVQNILGDILASLAIVLDKPFELGDFIVFGEVSGTIEHIGIKTTRIRSISGEQVVLSNATLLASQIRNFKRMYERRVLFGFGVTYSTSPEQVAWIASEVRKIVEMEDGTRFERAHFRGFGGSSLDFEVVYFVLSPEYNRYMDIQQQINLRLMQLLLDAKIEFAYPTQTIYLNQVTRECASN